VDERLEDNITKVNTALDSKRADESRTFVNTQSKCIEDV